MSTAGKVLVVLCALLTLVWVLLAAGVAQLNNNGGKALADLQKQVISLEDDVAKTQDQIEKLKDQISLEQVSAGEDVAVLRSRQAAVEQMRAEALEIESRMKIASEAMEATLKNAQLDRDHRAAEKEQMKKDLDSGEAEVQRLQAEHTELSDRLAKLRDEFQSTYRANKAKVDRLTK